MRLILVVALLSLAPSSVLARGKSSGSKSNGSTSSSGSSRSGSGRMGQMGDDPDFANWERPVDAAPAAASPKAKRKRGTR